MNMTWVRRKYLLLQIDELLEEAHVRTHNVTGQLDGFVRVMQRFSGRIGVLNKARKCALVSIFILAASRNVQTFEIFQASKAKMKPFFCGSSNFLNF